MMQKISIFGLLVLSILAAACGVVYGADAYVHLSVTGTNVNIRAEPSTGSKVITQAKPEENFIAEDKPVINPVDGSKWFRIVMYTGKEDYMPLEGDKRFGVTSAYISATFVSVTTLTEYGNERIAGLLADAAPAANSRQESLGAKTLPNMKTEESIREYLVGEWNFINTSERDYYSCRMVIDKDLNADFEFYDIKGKKIGETITGQFSFVRWPDTGAHEEPDALHLELINYKWPGGDFFFLHRTVYDKRRVMSLFYAGNGDCLFGLLDPSSKSEWGGVCPDEMVFFQETGEEYGLAPLANAEFYAVCWEYGVNRQKGVIWLDDIKWPPPGVSENFDPLYSGESYYLYETTQYDNETPVSVAYVTADDMKIEGGGLRYGKEYLVKTNGRGEIVNMRRAVHVRVKDSLTVLTYAAHGKSALEDVTALIEAGADVNAKNSSDIRDVTVLMWVASDGSPEVIFALIKAGADVSAKDECGKTALTYAAERNRNPETISVLLNAGANAKARDNDGKRAIDYASENENIKGTKAYQELKSASN